METWYFAYGSNLWTDQMKERTGAAGRAEQPARIARLADHRLVFQRLENTGPAFANILRPGDGVLGVIYRLTSADLEKLDHYERGYERQSVVVTDMPGEVLAAIVYVIKPVSAAIFGRPSAEYLQKIVTGARQHGLPEPYIGDVVNIASSAG